MLCTAESIPFPLRSVRTGQPNTPFQFIYPWDFVLILFYFLLWCCLALVVWWLFKNNMCRHVFIISFVLETNIQHIQTEAGFLSRPEIIS